MESTVRLFLSVDISGSTKIKNTKNYIAMYNRNHDIQQIYSKLQIQPTEKNENKIDIIKRILDSENLDWVKLISDIFSDFHSLFIKEDNNLCKFPWKVLGDELIYSIPVENRIELSDYVIAFYRTLRIFDKRLQEGNEIRLKGSAWTAGFPIRNRFINVPCPDLFHYTDNGKEKYCYPKEDYLGPEMDIGFRLGKCVWSGFLVASLELVYLLSESVPSTDIKAGLVGWEKLKGVWNDRCYPIFWLYLSEFENIEQYKYEEYCIWEIESDKFLKTWDGKTCIKKVQEYKEYIANLIMKLPSELGVEIPYFVKTDDIPQRHRDIIAFLEKIDFVIQENENQNDIVKNRENLNSKELKEELSKLEAIISKMYKKKSTT